MVLPENKKKQVTVDLEPDFWIYGDSYVGKSTFCDSIPNLLFINTDGNTDNLSSPSIQLSNEVTKVGRMIQTKYAWEVFEEIVTELEAKENSYKYIVLDLVEDLRELCRLYMYSKLKIQHESDMDYSKGWDMVTTKFNSTIKRIKNAGYHVVYISKELEKEVKPKGGLAFTTYKPNIQDKAASILAGTVDITMRAFIDDDGSRKLQLKKIPNVFGGGRYNFVNDTCGLTFDDLKKEIELAAKNNGGKK